MPITRNYTGGSIVYFQGDAGDDVYVLQQGRVVLLSNSLDTGEEIREEVQQGEFFGVRSAIGRYPREETAQVIGKTVLIVFKSAEFEAFVLKNTRLIMKMLRVFSKQLRNIHRQVRDLLKAGAARDPAYELINVAETFHRTGNMDHAIHAFERFCSIYPRSPLVKRAKELMDMARQGRMYPVSYPPLESVNPAPQEEIEPDHFPSDGGGEGDSITDILYEGLNQFSQGQYAKSIVEYDRCLAWKKLSNQEEQEMFARAHFEKGRAMVMLKQYGEASSLFSLYLKKFPTGEHVKESIFQIGIISEAQGQKDKARQLFHKVATMPPPDQITQEARKRLARMG